MTSNPTLHIHPNPPIDLDTEPDAITVIAAGIGSMRTRRRARDAKPAHNTVMLAIAVMESATGIDYNDDTAEYDGSDYDVAFTYVRSILDDLPRSVWNRVCDLLHDGRPDAALRVIQCHHTVVTNLSSTETWTGELRTGEHTGHMPAWDKTTNEPVPSGAGFLCWNFEGHGTPRNGYTYIKRGGLYYGPLPVNEFHPPMTHVKSYDVTFS